MSPIIDLHSHSTHSDGTWSVQELLIEAEKRGIAGYAVSDHDNLNGSIEAYNINSEKSLYSGTLIPAIEISTKVLEKTVHLLAFFSDLDFSEDSPLLDSLEKIRNNRIWRMEEMIKKANELNFDITLEEVIQEASTGIDADKQPTDILSRPHLARVMVKKGYVGSTQEAFDRYVGDGKPIHVVRYMPTYKEWVDFVKQEDGILIWAHPLHGHDDDLVSLKEIGAELGKIGIDGVERIYRYTDRYFIPDEFRQLGQQYLDELISENEWLITAGGDFHGDVGILGELELETHHWTRFLERLRMHTMNEELSPELQEALEKLDTYKKSGNQTSIIYTSLEIADLYTKSKQFGESDKYIKNTIPIIEKIEDKKELGQIFIRLGTVFLNKQNLKIAEAYLLKASDIAVSEGQKAEIYQYLTRINSSRNDYSETLLWATKALDIYKKLDNTKAMYNLYREIIRVYTRTKQKEKALEIVEEIIENLDLDTPAEYERARVYHSLKDYDNALVHFINASKTNPGGKIKVEIDNYIGRNYLKKKQPHKAIKYLERAYEDKQLFKKSLGYIFLHENLGTYHVLVGNKDEAISYLNKTLDLLIANGNLTYILNLFDNIPDKSIAYELALNHPFGILWIKSQYSLEMQAVSTEDWSILAAASKNWMRYTQDTQNPILNHWKIKQVHQSTQAQVTPETILTGIMGVNDLSNENFQDEQDELHPHWFVEFPSKVFHGDKYLKIRLNNRIFRDKEYIGYPHYNKAIDRVRLKIKTQWNDELNIDHMFNPNTQEEWQLAQNNPELVWLKDVFSLNLEEKSTFEDNIILTCQFDLYFDRNETPDIRTTNKNIVIPVKRRNRVEVVQKYKKNNENALAVIIAVASLLSSAGTISISVFNQLYQSTNDSTIIIGIILGFVGIIGIISIIGFLLLGKSVEKKIKDVHDSPFDV